ncbi:MAG: VanW family protein [Candidatus Moraniibacteriota bacterium]|nr:MAG: VanW family protein [Candidatus Moranbacteria bacterium]
MVFFVFPLLFISSSDVHAEIKITNPAIFLSVGEKFSETLSWKTYNSWGSFDFFIKTTSEPSSFVKTDICLNPHPLCSLETSTRSAHQRTLLREVIIDKQAVYTYTEKLFEKSKVAPVNAKFELTEENRVDVFHPGSDGYQIKIQESSDSIIDALEKIFSSQQKEDITITLPTEIIPAKITSSNAENFGITSLIGEGRSNFSGSSQDRLFNIRFGYEKYHGALIKPGEEFSFVEILGEVDEKNGWRPELVIRNNRTEPEYGGGICQVSTTLFRAAIFSGLKITMRQAHSYPVKYYEPIGFDASVYVPMPDMRFVNNTPGHILIQGEIKGKELIFRIYGTNDGRKVTVEEPRTLEKNEENGTLKTVFKQTVSDANGNIIIDKEFFSVYDDPKNYPKPEDVDLTEKPKDWSEKQWEDYKKQIKEYLKKSR